MTFTTRWNQLKNEYALNHGGRVRFGSGQTKVNYSSNNGLISIPFSVFGCQHQWLSSVKISSKSNNICGFYKHVKLVEKKIRAKGGGRVRFGSCQTSVNFSSNNCLILIPFSVYCWQHQLLSSVKISLESNNICEFYKHFKLVESIMSAKLRRPCSV